MILLTCYYYSELENPKLKITLKTYLQNWELWKGKVPESVKLLTRAPYTPWGEHHFGHLQVVFSPGEAPFSKSRYMSRSFRAKP